MRWLEATKSEDRLVGRRVPTGVCKSQGALGCTLEIVGTCGFSLLLDAMKSLCGLNCWGTTIMPRFRNIFFRLCGSILVISDANPLLCGVSSRESMLKRCIAAVSIWHLVTNSRKIFNLIDMGSDVLCLSNVSAVYEVLELLKCMYRPPC